MVAVLLFLLCLGGGIYNLFTGHFAGGGLLLGFCAVVAVFAMWAAKHRKQAVEFLTWIKSKQEELKKGWAFYRGQKITLDTEVTQYQGCISFVIMTSRFRSRYMVVGQGNAGTWLIFSGLTFCFGWWGFPWGFIFTPQALYRNLRGGYRQTVGTLLANIDAEIDNLTKSKTKSLSTIVAAAKAESRA